MTKRRLAPAELPGWPRFLVEELAAAYVGVSRGLFRLEVELSMWPQPERRGIAGDRATWDRVLIDRYADSKVGLAAGANLLPGPPESETEAEFRNRFRGPPKKPASKGRTPPAA